MKWYIWSPKSPNSRSLCIYPGLWLALYRGCINFIFLFFSFFFHNTCLTSNNTNFCTMSVASMGFSKSLVTSVMLCPAHRWMKVKYVMMSAHGRSFFLYSNGIVSPMKTMFVHEIDISGFVRWTSGWIVVFPSWVGVNVYSDPVLSHSMVWIRISHKGRRYV
jgi:hypothetical protein